MLSNVLLPTMLWLGQSPGITFLAPMPPGPQPEYARPVVEIGGGIIPPDPVIACIHRPGDLPYDLGQVDRAAMRIIQEIKWTRLREAEQIAALGPPSETSARTVPRRPPSIEQRRRLRDLSGEVDRHWQLFEARVYEVRMFEHRPEEGQLACRRAAEAWDALLGLIQQYTTELPPDLADELAAVDGWVGVLRGAAG